MVKVFSDLRDSQAERAAQRQAAWQERRLVMAKYLSSAVWRAKSRRAFLIWRAIGWGFTAGPLAGRIWSNSLHGSATFVLTWLIQDLAALGFAYAAVIRGTAIAQNRRVKRVGHHLGYQHVDTSVEANGIDNPEWPGCREHWYEIVPVTQAVNRAESLLRRDKPSKPRKRRWIVRQLIAWKLIPRKWLAWVKPPRSHYWSYLIRTLIAIALVRFWWVWAGFTVAVWAEGAVSTHMWMGWALWPAGASSVLWWLVMVGHRI